MSKLNTRASIVWTDPGTGTERVVLLDVPLRDLRPGYSQTAYTSESLDKTAIATITVGEGAHELVGMVRYEDNPQGLLDMVQVGATNTTLTYIPDLADPDQAYSVKLISPRSVEALTLDLDRQRALFGEMEVELRFRQTDETAFTELYDGTLVLFAYTAGNSLVDGTFSRADTATYAGKGYGTVTSAASGKARVHWMDTDSDGIRETPTLLLEGASTNLIVESSNFGTTWTNSGTALTSGQSDPAGGTSAYSINDDSALAAESVSITPTFTTDAVSKSIALFVKAGTATTTVVQLQDTTAVADRLLVSIAWSTGGVPTPTASTGTLVGTVRHPSGWYRILCRTTAVTVANTNTLFLYPAGTTMANTGTCLFYGVQAENALNPSSYIPTAGGTDTRVTDSLTFPFSARVQSMTLYVRVAQSGTLPYASSNSGIVSIGTSGAGTKLELRNAGGGATVECAASATSGAVTPGATHGQVVEYVAWLRYTPATRTSTTQVQAAVAGVLGTAGSVSAAGAMSDTFGSALLYLGRAGGGATQTTQLPFTHVRVARGIQDMLTMRKLAGVTS